MPHFEDRDMQLSYPQRSSSNSYGPTFPQDTTCGYVRMLCGNMRTTIVVGPFWRVTMKGVWSYKIDKFINRLDNK